MAHLHADWLQFLYKGNFKCREDFSHFVAIPGKHTSVKLVEYSPDEYSSDFPPENKNQRVNPEITLLFFSSKQW